MSTNWNQINTLTREKFLPSLVDNFFTSKPLFLKLDKNKVRLDGGRKIVQPLEIGETSAAGSYDGYDFLDTTPNDTFDAAEFNWRNYYVNVVVAEDEIDENMGSEQVFNIIAAKVGNARRTFKKLLAGSSGIFGTNTGTNIDGLGNLFAATSTAYGGITSESWWAPQTDSSTTTLSLAAMNSMYGDCSLDDEAPDIIVCDQDMWDRVWALTEPQKRYQSDEMAKAGFKSIMFNGTPVVVDPNCGSTDMYFLNTNFLFLVGHKAKNFSMTDYMKPVNQAVRIARIDWKGNLVCSNRRMQGKMSAITA